MTRPVDIQFIQNDPKALAASPGRVALVVVDGKLPSGLPGPARIAAKRAVDSDAWSKLKSAGVIDLNWPAGIEAEALLLVKLAAGATAIEARRAGAAIGARAGKGQLTVWAGNARRVDEIGLGLALRIYDFSDYKTRKPDAGTGPTEVTIMCAKPERAEAEAGDLAAIAAGVFLTRDLVSEPANVLTTVAFADRLLALADLGLEVEVLDEDALAELGMRALLGVGQGSTSPSKVVVLRWNGGGAEAPVALVGKGVVFDSGGISIKPAAGMEEMTMDMGGAGVVAGVMRVLATRKARANVVGLVGLVENMPDGAAQRPGDIVESMKGDRIEVINTDAEGRLVLADVLWYAQQRFQPRAVIDLATLTGAVIVALGHENAGVFSNNDDLAENLLDAAQSEGEGAWRLPLGAAYDKMIDSRLADIKNTGGRWGGAITAAQFLQRFIRDDQPWVHLDIAGVALPPSATDFAPKGASGWGVTTLNRLIRDNYEDGSEG